MQRLFAHLSLLLLAMNVVLPAQAVRFAADMNHAEWRLELSAFECRMWQPVPYFGDAVFSNRAGEEQNFYVAPIRKTMHTGQAKLVSEAPVWDESRHGEDLGVIEVKDNERPISVGKQKARQLLSELYAGMSPVFSRPAWYSEDESIELALSSVNFRKAYAQYQDCLVSLLPVNFEQINRSRIHFQTAKYELTSDSLARLEHVVAYVKADPSINGFYIDGHTDAVGRRIYNLELSKKRAEVVARYLVSNGVDESMITTRYHGERYPVASNADAKSRAQNRRVTIRLERDSL